MKMNALEIIEPAKSYYLLSNDKKSKPFLVGNRIKLEMALYGVDKDMIIMTMGNEKRCVILIDYTSDEAWKLALKANRQLMKIKAKN